MMTLVAQLEQANSKAPRKAPAKSKTKVLPQGFAAQLAFALEAQKKDEAYFAEKYERTDIRKPKQKRGRPGGNPNIHNPRYRWSDKMLPEMLALLPERWLVTEAKVIWGFSTRESAYHYIVLMMAKGMVKVASKEYVKAPMTNAINRANVYERVG